LDKTQQHDDAVERERLRASLREMLDYLTKGHGDAADIVERARKILHDTRTAREYMADWKAEQTKAS
jgi:hypothetical protein